MDGLVLRNRDSQIETVGFDRIFSIAQLQEERRASTLERIKGATAGGLVGGGAATVAAMLAVGITGPVGAVLGGAIGVMLAVKRKYHTCRIIFRDERQIIAIAEVASWAAIAASMPPAERRPSRWIKQRPMKAISSPPEIIPPRKPGT
jgi:hypothetical protein